MLFRSQLEGADFDNRVLQSEKTDPQTYVDECRNGIFSLLKKEYDTPRNRALVRDRASQADAGDVRAGRTQFAETGKALRAARDCFRAQRSIRSSTTAHDAGQRSSRRTSATISMKARDAALTAIHGFADRLEKRLPSMVAFTPMGEANYNYYLKHVLLLPLDAQQVEMLGRAELARYRALESLLPDPSLADPNPARSQEYSAGSGVVSESV